MSVPWQQIAASASSLLGNAGSAIGGHAASQAMQDAAWQQQQQYRRNLLMQLGINEPLRSSGYQALNDVNNFFGYSTPAYHTANQLATSLNPISGKDVKKFVKQGMSVDQIAGMGTLNAGKKTISRLIKAGLTPEQITRLQNGAAANASAPSSGGATGGATGSGAGGENWSVFTNSPDYQFALQQGTKNAGNSFAARGGAASGNALRALSEFNQGLASNQIDKFLNRRMGLVNGGQSAINNVGAAGNNYTTGMAGATGAIGDARASGILGVSNAWAQHMNDLGQIWGGGGMGGGSGGGAGGMMNMLGGMFGG